MLTQKKQVYEFSRVGPRDVGTKIVNEFGISDLNVNCQPPRSHTGALRPPR